MSRLTQVLARRKTPSLIAEARSRKLAIDEVRRLKRAVMIGVYGAIIGFVPFYAFVLHYTVIQLVIGTLIGFGIAICAIEGAFRQMFRFRKRSSYPAVVLVELGSMPGVQEAQQQLLDALIDLFDLDAAAVVLHAGRGDAPPPEPLNMGFEDLTALQAGCGEVIAAALRARESSKLRIAAGGTAPDPQAGATLAVVPVVAWGRAIGVILMRSESGKDLDDQELLDGVGVAAGVSLENQSQAENLHGALSVLEATLDSTADGILVVVGGARIESYNKRFAELIKAPEEILSQDPQVLVNFLLEQLDNAEEFQTRLEELQYDQAAPSFDMLRFRDGRLYEAYSQPQVMDGKTVGRVWCVRDVTQRVQSEQMIRRLAYHDALTDLPNRALFTDRLTIAIAQARRTRTPIAVLFLDIDRFKNINDTLGHAAGDEVLKAIGERALAAGPGRRHRGAGGRRRVHAAANRRRGRREHLGRRRANPGDDRRIRGRSATKRCG